jgi:hypothetical protein
MLKFAEGRTEEWIHKFRSAELERWLDQQTAFYPGVSSVITKTAGLTPQQFRDLL